MRRYFLKERIDGGRGGFGDVYRAIEEVTGAEYAIKFLQFVSSPEHITPWLATSGGIPVLADVEPAANVAGFPE